MSDARKIATWKYELIAPLLDPSLSVHERRRHMRAITTKKVEWPSRAQVIQGTIVVLIACIIVGAYLYAADQTFKPFVRNVLLGQ